MNYQQLLEQVEEYVKHYFQTHTSDDLVYHDQNHTTEVVGHATEIANHYQLNDRDFFVVVTAAWFHDIGYFTAAEGHEEHGALLAADFLKQHGAEQQDIDDVQACIRATHVPQSPGGLLQEIVCDADLFHLGTDSFNDKNKLLRKEYNKLHHTQLNKLEWNYRTQKFLEAQHYHTDYCRLLLDSRKEKNLLTLKEKIAKDEKEFDKKPEEAKASELQAEQLAVSDKKQAEGNKGKSKKDRPERGIETMFRVSSSNHQRLSDMADNKAHIMITVNSIILSAIISLLLRRLSEYEYLIIPTTILLTVSLGAMIFSILATRPSLPPGTFTRDDIDQKKVNLLFFGNFYKMSLDEYNYGMTRLMNDRDFLYGSLTKDLYAQGVVLGKKYRLLRIAYNIFMFGLIVAVIAFIIAAAFFGDNS